MPDAPPADTFLSDLADKVADARVLLDKAQDIEKQAREEYELAEAALFDALENANVRAIRTPRGLFTLNDLAWASIEDPEAARHWSITEMPELVTLNSQRLSKLVRDFLRGNVDEPGALTEMPPGVAFKTSRKITWRRQ